MASQNKVNLLISELTTDMLRAQESLFEIINDNNIKTQDFVTLSKKHLQELINAEAIFTKFKSLITENITPPTTN